MNLKCHTYWRELASGSPAGLVDKFVLFFLTPMAWLYAFALKLRAQFYNLGMLKTRRLPRPVISIGNITVGGTGKTPVTAYIARYLLAQGHRVAVLSRGYGGTLEGQTRIVSDGTTIMLSAEECGDEPYLLASTVQGLMVVIGTDRYSAGLLAIQQLAPDIFLLDDGFQHLRLHRDLNLLLLDFARPIGNGRTLPAGILREPVAAARRADLVIFTRTPEETVIPADSWGLPACTSHHTIVDLLPLGSQTPVPFSHCKEVKVLAFAGIADPDSFFAELRRQGLNLVCSLHFPDHVVYDRQRLDDLAATMRASGADFLITTEKDGVKLQGISQELKERILLARLELTIDNPDHLENLMNKLNLRHEA